MTVCGLGGRSLIYRYFSIIRHSFVSKGPSLSDLKERDKKVSVGPFRDIKTGRDISLRT